MLLFINEKTAYCVVKEPASGKKEEKEKKNFGKKQKAKNNYLFVKKNLKEDLKTYFGNFLQKDADSDDFEIPFWLLEEDTDSNDANSEFCSYEFLIDDDTSSNDENGDFSDTSSDDEDFLYDLVETYIEKDVDSSDLSISPLIRRYGKNHIKIGKHIDQMTNTVRRIEDDLSVEMNLGYNHHDTTIKDYDTHDADDDTETIFFCRHYKDTERCKECVAERKRDEDRRYREEICRLKKKVYIMKNVIRKLEDYLSTLAE